MGTQKLNIQMKLITNILKAIKAWYDHQTFLHLHGVRKPHDHTAWSKPKCGGVLHQIYNGEVHGKPDPKYYKAFEDFIDGIRFTHQDDLHQDEQHQIN